MVLLPVLIALTDPLALAYAASFDGVQKQQVHACLRYSLPAHGWGAMPAALHSLVARAEGARGCIGLHIALASPLDVLGCSVASTCDQIEAWLCAAAACAGKL